MPLGIGTRVTRGSTLFAAIKAASFNSPLWTLNAQERLPKCSIP